MQPGAPPVSSRSYTRPIQPPAPSEPRDFDPRSTSTRPPPPTAPYRRPSSSSARSTVQQDWDPRSSMVRTDSGQSHSSRHHPTSDPNQAVAKPDDWAPDEEAMLQLYGLSSLSPTRWEGGDSTDVALFGDAGGAPTGATGTAKVAGVAKGDELDPLGLIRGGVLATNPDLPSDLRSAVLLHSKSFDPKVFLSTVHPNATFKDLNLGRERLKESLEKRSGALKLLVEAEWDRFVGVKATTETVFEEMKHGGPLEPGADYGVKGLRETLKQASSRAETVFQPILDARTKADRLKSTLGVFERSKFFFNLPNILGEAVEQGKYDVALAAYKKGRYILASRPAQLLGLPIPTTPQQQQQQKRIYEKVWGQVEKIVGDLRATLGKRLRDTKRGVEEVEKTIEILLELDPTDDPVWIFFDTHHRHILQLMKSSAETSTSRIRVAMDQYGHHPLHSGPDDDSASVRYGPGGGGAGEGEDESHEHGHGRGELDEEAELERAKAVDLGTSVEGLDRLDGEQTRENGAGKEVWRLVFELVKNLNEVVLQTLPSFWKVAKGYMEGKYQKKLSSAHPPPSASSKRSPTQCRVMTQDIINLYVSLLSSFFTLSSSYSSPSLAMSPNAAGGGGAADATDLNATPPMPPFVPPVSNATTNAHWLLKTLNELVECVSEISSLELAGEASQSLKELVATTRWRFEEAICSGWVRDAKIFYRLETWKPDADDPSNTAYLRKIVTFQRFNAISAYRVAGGTEERANSLLLASATSSATGAKANGTSNNPLSNSRTRNDIEFPAEYQRKIQSAFLDALYAFLDGLVHVAFSDPDEVLGGGARAARGFAGLRDRIEGEEDTGRPKEVDIRNVDIRILLTVSNLTHLRETTIPRLVSQFQTAFKVDMTPDVEMLMEVTEQLDRILFDDYVKRKSAEIARIIRKGVLGGAVDWYRADKPKEVHPFIYDALLSLVLVHAQVSATARPLVARTLGSLVEELAQVALDAFSKVERFGMGGMLQATLEIEFMHQTLSQHVSPTADQTLQSIYKTISQSYYRAPTPNSAAELQQELEGLKRTLVASRRATALQFLCFRRPSKTPPPPQTTSGQLVDAPKRSGTSSSAHGGGGESTGPSRRGAVVQA